MVTADNKTEADFHATVEEFFEKGWTDGLPIVPPSEALVEAMLATVDRDPQEMVGLVPPKMGKATVEKIAINSVMAGCRPEYFRVVLAAIEAMLDDRFHLFEVQSSTWCGAPLIIVSGPIRQTLGINCGTNVFGHGFRANATIGRAVRLVLINQGGCVPDAGTKSALGHPGRFTFCIGEREEVSPWEPLHVENGFAADQSCITVFACDGPRHISGGLSRIADNMAAFGSINMVGGGETLVVIGPQIAQILGEEGWSKQDVKRYLFENSRFPFSKVLEAGGARRGVGTRADPTFRGRRPLQERWPKWVDTTDPSFMAPVVQSPDHILVVVAGGGGMGHCGLLPGMGPHAGHPVTRLIPERG